MEEAIKYFQSYEGYFWQWETDTDAMVSVGDRYNLLSIPHVSVIAYRAHALEILKVISEGGIPPFGAFLLVMYASGNFRFSNFDGLNYYLKKTEKQYGGVVDHQAVLQFLQSVSQLPEKLKKGENKVLLLHTVFNNCHNLLSAASAKKILPGIEKPRFLELCATPKPFSEAAYIRDLTVLQLLNAKFPDTQSIIQAMEGMPQLPAPEDEIAEEEQVAAEKSFIDLLIEEPKTFEVGNLIKHIWGGLKIPMQHFSPGDQPIGGIADMTNKGNIDRMLLSEFAYDDDIFLQRVANNEALYIQREIPPEKNIFERAIIIDISLRNWGTPKVLALATALAIARHPKAKDECRIFLAAKTSREIKHDTVEDIITALALVGPVPDCSEGLQDFFEHEPSHKKREIFFLTAEDSLRQPGVQKAISDYRDQFKFVVTFAANGTIQFFKMRQGAKRLLQTIVLPLEELWKRPPAKKAAMPDVKERIYPILFTAAPNPLGSFYLDGEYYFLSRKRILYKTYLGEKKERYGHSYHDDRGWEPVIRDISLKPKGSFALGKNEKGELLLCQYNPGDKVLSLLNLYTRKYLSIKYKTRALYSVLFHDNNFYFFSVEVNDYLLISDGGDKLVLSLSERKGELQQLLEAQQREANLARGYTRDILSNHHSVGITEEGHLHFSKHTLMLQHSNLVLQNNRPEAFRAVATRNGNSFCFDDGSVVLVDAEGMITLRSSNESLPDIFIPSCVSTVIAASTHAFFCGAEYYLPQNNQFVIERAESFYGQYIKAFIQQIITYADTA